MRSACPTGRSTLLIVLPQAIRHVIPPLVNTFIAFFKDTSLVLIIGIFDLLTTAKTAIVDPAWQSFSVEVYVFVGVIYFAFCFAMSRYSRSLEGTARPRLSGPGSSSLLNNFSAFGHPPLHRETKSWMTGTSLGPGLLGRESGWPQRACEAVLILFMIIKWITGFCPPGPASRRASIKRKRLRRRCRPDPEATSSRPGCSPTTGCRRRAS